MPWDLLETIPWFPSPLSGVAHQCISDDIYNGYYIPKYSTVLYNAWWDHFLWPYWSLDLGCDFLRAMVNNESDYPKPRQFRPERFLTSEGMLRKDDGVRHPIDIVFGFGRRFVETNYTELILSLTQFLYRICPGAHIGYSILWLTAASLLTVFDIDKTLDVDGHPIEPSCEYDSGAVSWVDQFWKWHTT